MLKRGFPKYVTWCILYSHMKVIIGEIDTEISENLEKKIKKWKINNL